MPTGDTEERTRAYADQLRAAYGRASTEGRQALLRTLATEHSGRPEAVHAAITRFEEASSSSSSSVSSSRYEHLLLLDKLRAELAPPYEALLSRVAREDGLPFLLELRKDLLETIGSRRRRGAGGGGGGGSEAEAEAEGKAEAEAVTVALRSLDAGLRRFLESWFSVGLLQLRRITYEESGGGVLEKIARYDGVHKVGQSVGRQGGSPPTDGSTPQHLSGLLLHCQQVAHTCYRAYSCAPFLPPSLPPSQVRGLGDLKIRLGPGRRCYAFFHPCVPHEPLVFVHVALLPEIATSMEYINQLSGTDHHHHHYHDAGSDQLLAESASASVPGGSEEAKRTTAIFYSINSTQPGLRGVELGNSLIKRVVQTLRGECPDLTTFSTLSPIPGLRQWLVQQQQQEGGGGGGGGGGPGASEVTTKAEVASLAGEGRAALLEKAARFITQEKRRTDNKNNKNNNNNNNNQTAAATAAVAAGAVRALDSVAHFHLQNGATVHSINWAADLSERGLRNSCGMMVNYKYDLDQIAFNSETYIRSGEVAMSSEVEALLLGTKK